MVFGNAEEVMSDHAWETTETPPVRIAIKPILCPVCIGRGTVSRRFLDGEEGKDILEVGELYVSEVEEQERIKQRVKCKPCDGAGIIWEKAE